ncbi:hypothetical protein GCM10023213_28610 [Prosthecobacter algae]|uniref:Uncharacterized protein n=1 Tax=Prosthecobacter algae TaxID=1144682 RepID=A0ABP9PAC3_9BACT
MHYAFLKVVHLHYFRYADTGSHEGYFEVLRIRPIAEFSIVSAQVFKPNAL